MAGKEEGGGGDRLPEASLVLPVQWDLSAQHLSVDVASTLRAAADEAGVHDVTEADVYGTGGPMPGFEAEMCRVTGLEAAAFVTTGTAANQACVRAALQGARPLGGDGSPPLLLVHPTSHLVHLDCLRDGSAQASPPALAEAVEAHMLGLRPTFVGEFHRCLSESDVEGALTKVSEAGDKPLGCLVMEIPQRMNGGRSPSWEELERISRRCRSAGIHLHMDGARMWEAAPRYAAAGKGLADLAGLFDSVYASFYKGLGATTGAVLLGTPAFVAAAAKWAKVLGSVPFSNTGHVLSCWRQLRTLGPGDFAPRMARLARMYAILGASSSPEAGGEESADGSVAFRVMAQGRMRFDPPDFPQSCICHVYLRLDAACDGDGAEGQRRKKKQRHAEAKEEEGDGEEKDVGDKEEDHIAMVLEAAHRRAQALTGVRLWNRLRGPGHSQAHGGGGQERYFEWSMGNVNASVPDAQVLKGWTVFFTELDLHLSLHSSRAPFP